MKSVRLIKVPETSEAKMKSESKRKGCLAQCMEPILCSCYSCMARVLTNVFMAVATCFLVYYGFLTLLQRREPGEAFRMAFSDFAGIFYKKT